MRNYHKLGMCVLLYIFFSSCSKTDADFPDASKNPENKTSTVSKDTSAIINTGTTESTTTTGSTTKTGGTTNGSTGSTTTGSATTTGTTKTGTTTGTPTTGTTTTGSTSTTNTGTTTGSTTTGSTSTTKTGTTTGTTTTGSTSTTKTGTTTGTTTTGTTTGSTSTTKTGTTTGTTTTGSTSTTKTGTTTGTTKTGTTTGSTGTTKTGTPPTTTKPVTTTPTKPTTTAIVYKIVAPINLYNKSNVTISGDSIAGGGVACIQLVNCTNIHITHCKLGNSVSYGILIANSSNILVDSSFITKVSTGILAVNCPGGSIRVQYNQVLNTQGPYPQGAGIQFSNVDGSNNRINYNKIQNIVGRCDPEDKISLYKSNGVAGDPIQVIGNWILGSGTSTTACGVTLGDQGGSYQLAQNNTIVNSGAGGMQIAGGTYISIINNSIYSAAFPWSHMGLLCANYSGQPSNNLTISGNKVNWTSGNPKDQINGSTTRVMNAGSGVAAAIGASTNILGANISASILPATIIDFH